MTKIRNTFGIRKSRNALGLTGAVMLLFLVLVGSSVMVEASLPPLPIKLDPLNPEHRDLLEPMFGTPLAVAFDPDANAAFYMGTEVAAIPEDTYTDIRYVLFPYEDVTNPVLTLESRGGRAGSGNPSHYIIFGWQDYKNYYYVYVPESPATRISRVVDGVNQDLYRHGSLIWVRDRDWYQDIRVELSSIDGRRVLDTYVNGELAMSYTFRSDQEPPPGRVGIGMWNLTHSAYLKNITLADQQ